MRKIVFMGTPDFAVKALECLLKNEEYDVKLVVSQPDKPQGRHHELTPPPVKQLALQYGAEIYQPETLKSDEAFEKISSCEPDFIIVSAYGKILPQRILDIPRYGCVNLHGSLLPKYRGAAPIQWCVINGDEYSGVTTMLMDAGMDTGDILLKSVLKIGEDETAGGLFDRLADLCPELLLKTLDGIVDGSVVPVPQNESEATKVGMLSKEMGIIDWHSDACTVHNKVRGMQPWPVAYSFLNGKTIKIHRGVTASDVKISVPGKILCKDGRIFVGCGNNTVYEINEIQAEGSKRMSASDYLRGHSIDGLIFGEVSEN